MSLAPALQARPLIRQAIGQTPEVFTRILEDGTNLALWQRRLPLHIVDFATLLLSLNQPLAESLVVELANDEAQPDLRSLAACCSDLQGYEGFIADVAWLISAFACLLGARRIGVRVRTLDKAMCPRFHVDHVPVRLITTYAGIGSQWLEEGMIERQLLGNPQAEPGQCQQMLGGEVALLKGEKWQGNEGAGLIHRSPALAAGERRLILTLDWLA